MKLKKKNNQQKKDAKGFEKMLLLNPFDNFQGQFKMQRKQKQPKRKNEKGSRKNFFWHLLAIFKAKEGQITKTIQNRKKKRKGFEKKFLLATPKDNFKGKGRKHENAKGRKHLEKQE